MNRATPSDDAIVPDTNGNGALDGGGGNASGADSPATDDTGQFDVAAPKNSGSNAGLFENAPAAAAAHSPPAKAAAAKPAAPVNAAPLPAAPAGGAAASAAPAGGESSPAAGSGGAAPLFAPGATTPSSGGAASPVPGTAASAGAPNPATGASGAIPVSAAPGVESATGPEELQTKPAENTAIEAPPLPPPNEFAGAPPIPGTMRNMAEGEAPEEYTVEHGDNLYDICGQLLDEAGYWPKLWALNPEIKNPHFIFPNMRLRFYAGDDDTPPYLQVVTEDDVIPIDKGVLDEAQLVAEKVFFPQTSAATEYIVEVIGPSQVDLLQDEILTGGHIYNPTDKPVHVPAFLYSEEREALGLVSGGRQGESSVSAGGKVFVDSEGGVNAGTLYTVLRPAGEIEDPESGDFIGYRYYFVANVRILRPTEDQAFTGQVQDSQLGVMAGDMVVQYISTRRSVPLDDNVGPMTGTAAHIVAWENIEQEVGGRGTIALIDKGSSGGVTVGSYLPVYATPGFLTLSSGDSGLPVDYEMIGAMRIIDVTDAGACGYIVRSTDHMRIGDRTGKG